MPELPEVETIRRQLAPALRGRTVSDAWAHGSARFASATEVVGARLGEPSRRGKYLLVPLDDGRELVLHLGMTGRLAVAPGCGSAGPDGPGTTPPGDPHLRAAWQLDDGVLELVDVRRFGRVAVVEAGDYAGLPTLASLGPEPLGPDFTADHLWRSVRRSSAHLKTQLLNQRVVAGVGNIYADEALWQARLAPTARTLSRPGAERLHRALVDVLTSAIEHRGTTFRDYRSLDGSTGGHQFHLQCYGRAGEPCERCGTVLRRSVVDGRGTTSCPRCQRR